MNDNSVYFPALPFGPFGSIPIIGNTMDDEKERELSKKYSVKKKVNPPNDNRPNYVSGAL